MLLLQQERTSEIALQARFIHAPTAWRISRASRKKEPSHECNDSIFQSLLPIDLFRCPTFDRLGYRRKMGTLCNRWIRALLGNRRATRPRCGDGRVGWYQRVQSRNVHEKQGKEAVDIGRTIPSNPSISAFKHPRLFLHCRAKATQTPCTSVLLQDYAEVEGEVAAQHTRVGMRITKKHMARIGSRDSLCARTAC